MDSQVVAIENPEAKHYSVTNEYLAALIETVDATSWRPVAAASGRRGWKPPKPQRVPRPWEQQKRAAPKARRKATPEDMRQVFGDRMKGGG